MISAEFSSSSSYVHTVSLQYNAIQSDINLLTLYGLIGQKTHRGGLGLGESVHEEAHPCFSYFTEPPIKSIPLGSINCPLIQLIPSVNYSIRERYYQQSCVHGNLTS